MDLFALPVEIRLRVYSELLIHRETITFPATFASDLTPCLSPEGIDLWPTLLRTSKQMHAEAISLLYSDNCFRFLDLDATCQGRHTTIAVFVRQIGAQAQLLRHVCIDLPAAPLAEDNGLESGLQEVCFENLDLLRDACRSIKTLELSLPSPRADFVLRDSLIFTKLLDLIHERLQAFPCLREVRVDVKLSGWDFGESDDEAEDSEDEEQENSRDDRWKTRKDSIRQLRSRDWTVNITKVPSVKEVWLSPDDMFEFDDEDDYNSYMIEWGRQEQHREEQEWAEYYHTRQLESYRRGYADDGGPA